LTTLPSLLALLLAGPAWGGPPAGLKRSKPIVCRGNKGINLTKRLIETKGDAITLMGNCNLVINRAYITAGGTAIKVMGNGDVKILDSHIQGKRFAVQILGNGTVVAEGSTFVGKIGKLGSGEFKDAGRNTFGKGGATKQPAEKPTDEADKAPPKKLKPAPPVRNMGSNDIKLVNRLIKTNGNGVSIMGSGDVTLIGCRIEAGKNGISIMGSGDVTLKDCYIKGKASAVSIMGSGDVTASGSQLYGGIRRLGSGKYVDNGGNTVK
jgi:hypothetical protein